MTRPRTKRVCGTVLSGASVAAILLAWTPTAAQSIKPPSPPAAAHPPRVVVILDFDTTGQGAAPGIGRSVAEGMRVYMSRSPHYQIVERQRLDSILREQKLQVSDLIDPRTASRVGKLVGADAILYGMVSRLGNAYWLTARLIDVATSRSQESADVRAETETAIRRATYELASKLGLGEMTTDGLDDDEEEGPAINFDPDLLNHLQTGMKERANADFDAALTEFAYVRERLAGARRDTSEIDTMIRGLKVDGTGYARELIKLLRNFDTELSNFAAGGELAGVITRLRAVNHRYYQLLTKVHATDATSPWEEIIDDFERAERTYEDTALRGRREEATKGLEEMRRRTGQLRSVIGKMIHELEKDSGSRQGPQ